MKNIYINSLVLLLFCFTFLIGNNHKGQAQTLVAAEYFFNTDPGIGNATPFPIPVGDSISASHIIPTTGLGPGFNHLFIRVKNNLGKWSIYGSQTIYVKESVIPTTNVINGEYFFNTDPGFGNATPFSFTPIGNDVSKNLSISTLGLNPGFNALFIRVKENNGRWSLYEERIVFVNKNMPDSKLVYGEYFFDNDSGVGNGIPFTFIPVFDKDTFDFEISTTGLTPGTHHVFFRFRDTAGTYSLYASQPFRLCDIAALANFKADTVCLGLTDSTTFTNLSINGDASTIYRWDFDGNGTNDLTHQGIIGQGAPYQFKYLYPTGGTFQCRLVTDNGGGCSDTAIIPVLVRSYTPPPIPTGPSSLCINSPNSSYSIPAPPGATNYTWTILPAPPVAGVLTANNNTAVIDWNNTFTGNVQLSVKVDYGPCISLQSAPYSPVLNIQISPQTIGGSVSLTNSSICEGSLTGIITVSGYLGTIVRWEKRLNGGATWIHIPNQSATLNETPTVPGSWDYRAVIKNNACDTAWSGYATITVNPKPAPAGNIIGPSVVCAGQTQVNFTVPLIPGATNYTWAVPNGAYIVQGSGTNSILVNFQLGANTGAITVFGSNSCGIGVISQPFGIIVNPAPVAEAGPNQLIQHGSSTTLSGSAYGGTGSVYTYAWTPSPLFVNANLQSPQTIGMLNSTTFTLTVTDSLGCQATDMVNITVHGQPLSATPVANPPIVCQGDTTQLFVLPSGGSGTYTYQWTSNPPGSLNSTLQNPKVAPTATTSYIVAVNDGSQIFTAAVTVTISPKPLSAGTISGPTTVCAGQQGVVYTVPSITNASGYTWLLPLGATLASGSNTNTISVNYALGAFSGQISVFGTNICGSGNPSPNLNVTVNQLPAPNAGTTQNISLGQSTTLNGSASGGSGNFTYVWGPSQLLVPPVNVQNVQTIGLTNSTTFTLTVTDNVTSCSSTASVLVIVTGFPLSATSSAVPGTICGGDTSQLNALPSGGTGAYAFVWSSNPPGLSYNVQNPMVSPSVTTTYTVTITAGGETAVSNVVVTVSPIPGQAGPITGDIEVCKGETSVAYSVPVVPGSLNYYNWSLPPGATIYSGNGTNSILVNYGLNAVSGNVSVYAANLCGIGTVSAPLPVTVNVLPIANAGSDIVILQNFTAVLNGSASGGSGNYTYAWSPAVLLDNPNIPNPETYTLNNSYAFTLTVTDVATMCTNTSVVNVIVSGGPLSATASPYQTICQGTSTQINALPQGGSGTYTYMWSSNTQPPFTSTLQNPIVSPTTTTEYTVIVDDGGSFVSASTFVYINPLPVTPGAITGDNNVCQNESGVLYNVDAIQYASGYMWYLPTGTVIASGSNQNSITVNFTSSATSGNIMVAGTNFCGIGDTSVPFSVTVQPLPIVDAGQDVIVPQNTSVQLSGSVSGGSGNYTYYWTPPGSVSNPNILNPTTQLLGASAIFTLNVTDNATGCTSSDMVQVMVSGVPLSVSASATPSTVCQGAQSSLFALPTGGVGVYSYAWSSNTQPPFTSTLQNPTVSPTVTTTYTVTISDGSTTNTHSVVVTVSSLPGSAGQITGPTAVCKGTQGVSFSVPLIQGATSYVWTLPTGATIASGINSNSILVNFTAQAVTGQVSVYGANPCGNGPSSSYQITINPTPTANAGQDLYIIANTSDTLHGSATGGFGTYSYEWAPPILLSTSPFIQNPITVNLTNPTTYYLTVTDNTSGCTGTDNVNVYIINPGTFTVAVMPSPQNICQGQSSTLNTIPSGGVGNYSYQWASNPTSSISSSTLQNPIVSPTVTTTYYVTCTSGTSTATYSAVVTVSPIPSAPGAITGTSQVCQGTNFINYYVAPVSGATSYNWNLPYGSNIVGGAGSNSITVSFSSGATSGPITVSGTNLCGSGSSSNPFQVTVNPSPSVNAGNDQFISVGSPATLMGSYTPQGSLGPFTTTWSPAMFFGSQTQTQQLQTSTNALLSSVTFTLTVVDSASGCSASDQVNVYIGNTTLTATANASPSVICQGQSSQLNALPSGGTTQNYQYLWTSLNGPPFTSNLQNPIVTPTITTQYLLKVYNNNDSAAYSLVVQVNPLPGAAGTITGPVPLCQGSSSAVFSVPSIAYANSYVWNLPNQGFTLVSGGGTNTIYVNIDNNAPSGTITVMGQNACGLGTSSPVYSATVSVSPFAYTSADQYIPTGSSTVINGYAIGGSGTYTYIWQPAQYLDVNTVQNCTTAILTQSVVYTLVVTDNVTGCQSTDNVQIIVYGGPLSVVASSSSYNICSGQAVQLNALPSGGNGNYTYLWTPNTALSSNSVYNPIATPTTTTEYTVKVTAGGSTATHSVLITVSPQPGNAGTITGSNSVCQGETGVLFSVPPIANATSYYWTVPFGATIVSGGNTNTIMVNFSGIATSGNISVYGGNICGYGNASANFYVNVNPIPYVNAGVDQQIQQGLNAFLNGAVWGGSGAYSFQWTPSNLIMIDTILNPATQPLSSSQIFTLTVTDIITGCVSSDYMKVIICGGPLSVDAFVNSTSICEGQTVQLDALPSGGNCVMGDYLWTSTPASGFSSILVNPIDAPTVTTTYTVTYNDGANTATDAIVVNVNLLVGPAGNIQGPVSVCQNSGMVTYSVPPITGADHYVWTFPHGATVMSNPDSNVVQVLYTDTALTGFVNVYGTSFCGIGQPATSLYITVKPLPGNAGQIVGPSYMTKNNTAQFSIPPIPGVYTYYWVLPYGAIIIDGYGTNSITVEFTDDAKSGFVYAYGVNSCGNGDPSNEHLVTIITSIAELYGMELKMYPNPNNGAFMLEIYGNTEFSFEMEIMDLFGRVVHKSLVKGQKNHINLMHLPNGMYYIVLNNNKIKLIERFVIAK